MKIEIFETNAGCGYQEKAILLKVAPLQYVCIDAETTQQASDFSYQLGGIVTDQYDDLFLSPIEMDIRQSAWYQRDPFLAEFFIDKKFEA